MKKLCILLMLSFLLVSCGLQEKESQGITFSDKQFEEVIRNNLNKSEGIITKADMCKVTSLKISGINIKNIQEIEYCNNLSALYLDNTKIDFQNVLTKLNKLTDVEIVNQEITDLSFLNACNLLKTLKIDHCNFSGDLSTCGSHLSSEQLTRCVITHTNLKTLTGIGSFIGDSKIKYLTLNNNRLTSIDGIQNIKNLDFPVIDLRNNKLTDLAPLCTVKCNRLLIKGNNIYTYSPVADLTGDEMLFYEGEESSDFIVPKSEIVFCVITDEFGGENIKFDRSPVQIENQEIFVSPKYFLYNFGFSYEITKNSILLSNGKTDIRFTNQGRTMIFEGKKYTSPYPAYKKDGVVYVPIRFVVEKLGGKIKESKREEDEIRTEDYQIVLPDKFLNSQNE